MIPKNIYYAWFGNNDKGEKLKKNIENWQRLNPDFKIIEINESNFDIHSYSFTEKAYKQKMWAFVSDVARLEFVHKYGGFYFDVDVELLKPIDDLCEYDSVWALENTDAIASGLVVGGKQFEENIGNLLDIYRYKMFDANNLRNSLCIPIVTEYFYSRGFKRKNKKQILDGNCIILPTQYFAPLHMWGGGKASKETIGIHHYEASWIDGGKGLNLKGRIIQSAKYYFPPVSILYDLYKSLIRS